LLDFNYFDLSAMRDMRPLGELETQQLLNMQQIINGAQAIAMYLQEGETLNDIDPDIILADLQALSRDQTG
jgi:hypothetical protein